MSLSKGIGIADFVRHAIEACANAEIVRQRQEPPMELGNRHRFQREGLRGAVARAAGQLVIDEIEVELHAPACRWNRRCRQAARGNVERCVPRMVQPRRVREPILAHDLRPQMHRGAGVFPGFEGDVGPCLTHLRVPPFRWIIAPWRSHANRRPYARQISVGWVKRQRRPNTQRGLPLRLPPASAEVDPTYRMNLLRSAFLARSPMRPCT